MNLYLFRKNVRQVLRDESFPAEDIDSAINRVIKDINTSGRYRFHESEDTITLTTSTYSYAVDSDILAEHAVVYKAFTTDQVVLDKIQGKLENALALDLFTESADYPTQYLRWGQTWYFDPIPNATANGNTITIFCMRDLAQLYSPLDTCSLPDRHANVIIYGAAGQINPLLKPDGNRGQTVTQLYQIAFNNMRLQEKWDPDDVPTLVRGPRWNDASSWGNVSTVR